MEWYFSKSAMGFFNDVDHGPDSGAVNKIPLDAVVISDELRQQLLSGQCQGKIIVAGTDGVPSLS